MMLAIRSCMYFFFCFLLLWLVTLLDHSEANPSLTSITASKCCIRYGQGLGWCPRDGGHSTATGGVILTFTGYELGDSVTSPICAAPLVKTYSDDTNSVWNCPLANSFTNANVLLVSLITASGNTNSIPLAYQPYALPTLNSVSASAICVGNGLNGLSFCPPSTGTAYAITLTFSGSNFGLSGASINDACADTPVHVKGFEFVMITCRLKQYPAGTILQAAVTTSVVTTSTAPISIGFAAFPNCYDQILNGDETTTDCGGSCGAACPLVLFKITSTPMWKCLEYLDGLAFCPPNPLTVGPMGVTLTFIGQGFTNDAWVNNACVFGTLARSISKPTNEMTCSLAPGQAGLTLKVAVVTSTAISQSLDVHYGLLPTCTDGIKNGDETGVDKGGSCELKNVGPSCNDGLKNGDETGVDCGGAICSTCDRVVPPGPAVALPTVCSITTSYGCLPNDFDQGLVLCSPGGGVRITFTGENLDLGIWAADKLKSNVCESTLLPFSLTVQNDPNPFSRPTNLPCGTQTVACTMKPAAKLLTTTTSSKDGATTKIMAVVTTAMGESTGLPITFGPSNTCCDGIQNGDEERIDCGGSCPACTTYFWDTSAAPFPPCPTACGLPPSLVTRVVTCKDNMGNVVTDAVCAAQSDLEKQRACPATLPCVTYAWDKTQAFSACPTTCGLPERVITRSVVCRGSDGQITEVLSLCMKGPNGEALARDDTKVCPATKACIEYFWDYNTPAGGPFLPCPTQCGSPATTLTRVVVCRGTDGVVVTDESKCSNAGEKNNIRQCSAMPACGVVYWDYDPNQPGGTFPPCPVTCGAAASTVTRTVTCKQTDPSGGAPIPQPESACAASLGPKINTLACAEQPPCVTYVWDKSAPFPSCPTDCGLEPSVVSRNVPCVGSDGVVYPEARCVTSSTNGLQESVTNCLKTKACAIYAWKRDETFPDCPTECGYISATVVNRNVLCQNADDGTIVNDSFCVGSGSKDNSKVCPPTSTCVTYAWDRSEPFPTCPTPTPEECGSRNIDSVISGGSGIGSSESNQSGSGNKNTKNSITITRTVLCKNQNGKVVDDSMCISAGPKTDTRICAAYVCPLVTTPLVKNTNTGSDMWSWLLPLLLALLLLCLLCMCIPLWWYAWKYLTFIRAKKTTTVTEVPIKVMGPPPGPTIIQVEAPVAPKKVEAVYMPIRLQEDEEIYRPWMHTKPFTPPRPPQIEEKKRLIVKQVEVPAPVPVRAPVVVTKEVYKPHTDVYIEEASDAAMNELLADIAKVRQGRALASERFNNVATRINKESLANLSLNTSHSLPSQRGVGGLSTSMPRMEKNKSFVKNSMLHKGDSIFGNLEPNDSLNQINNSSFRLEPGAFSTTTTTARQSNMTMNNHNSSNYGPLSPKYLATQKAFSNLKG